MQVLNVSVQFKCHVQLTVVFARWKFQVLVSVAMLGVSVSYKFQVQASGASEKYKC